MVVYAWVLRGKERERNIEAKKIRREGKCVVKVEKLEKDDVWGEK